MLHRVDPIVSALVDEQAETAKLLAGIDATTSQLASRCSGWTIADVLLHLAQSDELAIASLTGTFVAGRGGALSGWERGAPVDQNIDAMVDRERGAPFDQLVDRWKVAAAELVTVLDNMNLSTRVPWVVGELSARALATTRLSETWIHTGDIADALGVEVPPSDRLQFIARLAWRTLPHAFSMAGLTMSGPVAFRLQGPSGNTWEFLPDEPALTTVSGSAVDLCEVAARRHDAVGTTLRADGPDAANVLALVRTYA